MDAPAYILDAERQLSDTTLMMEMIGKRSIRTSRRASCLAVGHGTTRVLQAYSSRSWEPCVRHSTTMWARRVSGTANPGKSSSSTRTAARTDCASESLALLVVMRRM